MTTADAAFAEPGPMRTQGPPNAAAPPAPSILFFDGVCNLCNALASFVLKHDVKSRIVIASLQGKTAARLLAGHEPAVRDLSTVVLLEGDAVYTRSTAILRAVRHLDWPWRVFALLLVVPAPIRDWIYRQVALRRFRWFGQRTSCRMPTAGERARFLD